MITGFFTNINGNEDCAAESISFEKIGGNGKTEMKKEVSQENEINTEVIQPNGTVGKDSFIWNDGSEENYGEGFYAYSGASGGDELRALIEFEIPNTIGNVKSAKLSLNGFVTNNPVDIKVYPVSNYWIEGTGGSAGIKGAVNWANRTTGTPWDTAGGDYIASPSSHLTPELIGMPTWYSWDITPMVRRWTSGEMMNFGVIMVPTNPGINDYFGFYTSEYGNPDVRPKLKIDYHAEIDPPVPNQRMSVNGGPRVVNLTGRGQGTMEHESRTDFNQNQGIPFLGTGANHMHYQNLYTAEEVGAGGKLTRISFNRSSSFSDFTGNFSNFKMSLAHTQLDNLTDDFTNNYDGNLVPVHTNDNIFLNSSNNDPWIHFDLEGNFVYDDSKNLLVDIQWSGDDGDRVPLKASNNNPTNRRLYAYNLSQSTGNTDTVSLLAKFEGEVSHTSVKDEYIGTSLYPLSSMADEMRYQMLYHQDEIEQKGTLDKLFFQYRLTSTGIITLENFSVRLAHSTNDNLQPVFEDNPSGPWEEVFNESSYTIMGNMEYQWVELDIEDEFYYNNRDNLLIEMRFTDSLGDNIKLTIGGASYDSSLYNDSSYTADSGTVSSTHYNIQLIFAESDEFWWEAQSLNPELVSAEVVGNELIITPEPNAMGMGTVEVNLVNSMHRYVTQQVSVEIDMKDTYITNTSGLEYRNYGEAGALVAGNTTTEEYRSLIGFDMPAKEGTIIEATISMYCFYIENTTESVTVELTPITNPWMENYLSGNKGAANWYNRTTDTPWDTPGGDHTDSFVSTIDVKQDHTRYEWDITEIAKAWKNGSIENNGLMITGETPLIDNYIAFYQSEVFIDEYTPIIEITYKNSPVPDQVLDEDQPTRSVPLSGDEYNTITSISGPMEDDNLWPFHGSFADECHYQALYTPEQVGAEGDIKRISLKRSSMTTGNYSNFNISMAHTTVMDLSTVYADNYQGDLIEVYAADNYVANSSDGDLWLTFDLNGEFTYDSSYNLLVDIKWDGNDGTSIFTSETTGFSENRRVYGNDISSASGMGATTDLPVMRFETDMTDVGVFDNGTSWNWNWIMGNPPFNPGVFSELRYQMLNKKEQLNGTGTIDKIRFQSYSEGYQWSVVENLSIRLAHSSNESLGQNFEANHITPWVEVLNKSRYKLVSMEKSEWIEIELDNIFEYNGNDNLVIDIRWRGGYARYYGMNLTVDNTISYNASLLYNEYNAEKGGLKLPWMYNMQTIFIDNPQWNATSSEPSLFTTDVSTGDTLDITPQPEQSGNGIIDLYMKDCNGYLLNQQEINITIISQNDAPELTGPSTVECTEDVDEIIDMSLYVSDVDNDISDLTFSTNSSYTAIRGYNITFDYPNGILHEMVNITVEDPGGMSDYYITEVTVTPVNDPPVLSGPSLIECDEDVDEIIDMSTFTNDIDNSFTELTYTTNSSYAVVNGYNITFNYPEGILHESVNITVEDPEGLTDYYIADVTITAVNDAPELSGVPSTIECDAGQDYVLDMSSYVSDVDNDVSELTFSTDSDYTTVDGVEIIFNYPDQINQEIVNITVEDPGGLTDVATLEATVTSQIENPEIVTTSPSGSGVSPSAVVVVEFNIPMDNTETKNSLSLTLNGNEIEGVFSWNQDETIMTFNPDQDLGAGSYTVVISTQAVSKTGENLQSEHSWTFSVSTEDSDGDGMSDEWEEENGLDPNSDDSQEDPDEDGLPNIWEFEYGFNPQVDDSDGDADGDGSKNIEEYEAGTNPRDSNDYPEDDGTGDEEDDMWLPLWLLALIGIVIILIVIISLLMFRKRSEPESYEEFTMEESQPVSSEISFEEETEIPEEELEYEEEL